MTMSTGGGLVMSRRCVLNRSIDESELASLGERRKNARVERRILALRMIAAGQLAVDIAPIVGVNEKTVRYWVQKYNCDGVNSLRYDACKGSQSHLSPEAEEELKEAIRRGPPPEMKIGVWRGWAL